jgi:cytochrome b pre-mRNA-processing protein 3
MTRPFPWPFARRKDHPPARAATIEMIYGMIVAQARLPDFYQRFNVPDTVSGRFDMVVLHLWMVLRRLRAVQAGAEAQALFDCFCSDMDANLREMGVGDLVVPKRMRKFGEAFYGRSAAYDAALVAGADQLGAALARNVLVTTDVDLAAPLARYLAGAVASLDTVDRETLLRNAWRFPVPD